MQPCYHHNDYILISKPIFKPLSIGDDIVCIHPSLGLILKRIKHIENQKLELTGLNQLSTDSNAIGKVNMKEVLGRVVWHIKK